MHQCLIQIAQKLVMVGDSPLSHFLLATGVLGVIWRIISHNHVLFVRARVSRVFLTERGSLCLLEQIVICKLIVYVRLYQSIYRDSMGSSKLVQVQCGLWTTSVVIMDKIKALLLAA